MTLDDMKVYNTKRNYKVRYSESLVENFKYNQPFGFHFGCCNQVKDHNNRRHSPISLDSTWDTKFWTDCKFTLYLSMMEGNTALSSRHFQNGGNVMPILDFGGKLVIQ